MPDQRFRPIKASGPNGAMKRLAKALHLLDQAAVAPDHLPNALEELAGLLGYRSISVLDTRRGSTSAIISRGALSDLRVYEDEGWRKKDERAHYFNRAPVGVVVLDHEIVPEHVRASSAVYRDYYGPRDLPWAASWKFILAGDAWRFACIRSARQGPVSPGEAAMLEKLRPAADRTINVAQQFREARAKGIGEGAALTGQASILINHHGCVSYVSPAAEALMDASFGMTGRRLRAADAQCNASLRQLGKAARDDEPASAPPSIVIPRGSDRRPLLVQVVPVRGLGLDMLPGTRLALLVTDLGRDSIADPDDLRALFQLSSSEAEVATLIARGFTVREIANRRGVADETVRVQIKSLFRKMEVKRQSDVVRLIDRVAQSPLSTEGRKA